jgi:probable phosphoglycerate mutase
MPPAATPDAAHANPPGGDVFLVRHGETEWSRSGRHTGRTTDLSLTENGRRSVERLAPLLAGIAFEAVFTSPLRRARETCELAGLGAAARLDPDLMEWDYGTYEGRTTADIRATAPGWRLFADGCPGGESPADVALRADRVISRVRAIQGRVAIFAHGHLSRVLAARWIGLPAGEGERFVLDTSTVSVLGHSRGLAVVKRWNAPLDAAGFTT